jgi:hypothetical protein
LVRAVVAKWSTFGVRVRAMLIDGGEGEGPFVDHEFLVFIVPTGDGN